jgi:hypothetical protein
LTIPAGQRGQKKNSEVLQQYESCIINLRVFSL